jgi:hypothetical protein
VPWDGEETVLTAEQAPDLLGQIVLGEWLGQERRAGLEQAVLEYFGREPRHVQDRLARPALLDVPPKLPAIHPRHLDVGKDKMNAARVLLDRGYRFPAVTCFERLIAGPGQHAAGQTPDSLFIVYDQDREAAGRPLGPRVRTGRALRYGHLWMYGLRVPCSAKVSPGCSGPQAPSGMRAGRVTGDTNLQDRQGHILAPMASRFATKPPVA